MARTRTAAIVLLLAVLAACQQDASFRREGAGADLYHAGIATSTANLNAYFDRLCEQADIPLTAATTPGDPRACDTGALGVAQWARVVQAGYNDIDARCDAYLSWLEAKRNERLFANQATAALAGLLGGILTGTGATEALGYVALALGFGGTIYNAYHDTLLLGLETSTIKTIVTERRLQFQDTFREASYASKPDAVRALRAYLRICTPATITMDVNTYSRVAASRQPSAGPSIQERELLAERRSLSTYRPATASQPVTQVPPRPVVPLSTAAERMFVGPGWTGDEVRTVQTAFCIPRAQRGQVSPRTLANMELIVEAGRRDRRLTENDYRSIRSATASSSGEVTCDDARHQNYYENSTFRADPDGEAALLKAAQELFSDRTGPAPTSLTEGRRLIGLARVRCGLPNTGAFADQVTPDLSALLAQPLARRCGGPR